MPRPSDPNAKIKLLCAAEAEFAENGLDKARVEGITARAGLSKGAFYLHFQSKEDAFKQLVETTLARLAVIIENQVMDQAVSSPIPPSFEAVLEAWRATDKEIFEFCWQNRTVVALLMQGGSSADYRYLADDFAERARAKCARDLAQGQHYGLFRKDFDVDVASIFLAGAYDRFVRMILQSSKKPNIEDLVRQIQNLVLGGVGQAPALASNDLSVKNSTVSDRDCLPSAPAPRLPVGARRVAT
jgi:AcrR family transcriptional regulator